jgi:hypothetical protein
MTGELTKRQINQLNAVNDLYVNKLYSLGKALSEVGISKTSYYRLKNLNSQKNKIKIDQKGGSKNKYKVNNNDDNSDKNKIIRKGKFEERLKSIQNLGKE